MTAGAAGAMIRVAAVALLATLLLWTAAGTASAHAALVATDPAKDATLGAGPQRVSATFNEPLQTRFAAMTIVGPDERLWHTGEPQVQGAVVSVAVRPLGPAGTYTVHYRVTSADGHPVSGSWSFELTTPGTGEPGPAVSEPTSPESGDPGDDAPVWPFALGVIAVVGTGLWVTHRKR